METKHSNLKSLEKIIPLGVVMQIKHLDRSLFTEDEQFHIDLFLLSYYTGGISLRDLAHLTRDKVKDTELDCTAIPYPQVEAVPLSDRARVIIGKYKDRSSGNYLLPVFSCRQKTAAQREGCVKRLTAKANATFRKIEQVLGCGPVTWQGARLAYIARMIEDKVHSRDIYAFAGSTARIVDAEYSNRPGNMDEIYKRMNQRM